MLQRKKWTVVVNAGLLVSMIAIGATSTRGAPPAAPGTPAKVVAFKVNDSSLMPIKSKWADYFGTHYARTMAEAGIVWNTVRSYGGPHVGFHTDSSHHAPARKGPFTGKDVFLELSDFHGPRGGMTAEQLIPELIEHDVTGIYLMTNIVRPSEEPFDKDRAYWAVRLIHEKYPEAADHVVWQIGNEVVSGHFDPKGVWNAASKQGRRPAGMKEDNFFGYDLDWKEEYYVNRYLAPAIEAIERASADVYGDPHRIRIALGSMNPYNRPNLVFLKNVMARKFDGKQAATLKGEDVWKHIDLLTVHYMTGSAGTMATLQTYCDEYLRTGKVKGIWITEDHGRAGRGPVTIVDRGMRFLAWAAENKLSADQTRLCWWGEMERDPGGQGKEATTLLGEFLAGRQMYLASQSLGDGTAYLLADGNHAELRRILVAVVPDRDRSLRLDHLQIEVPVSAGQHDWSAEAIQYSSTKPGEKSAPRIEKRDHDLTIHLDRDIPEPALVLITAHDGGQSASENR